MIDNDVIELQKFFYQTNDYLDDKKTNKILILGIGNYLMGDEGIGVHAIHALSKVDLPDNVDIMDGGTGSFELMPILAKYPTAIFIDATMDGREPGTIDVIYPEFAADFPTILSAHDVGLKDMLDALEIQEELPRIALVTITIADIIPMSIELTDKVKNSIPNIVDTIERILNNIDKFRACPGN